MIKIELLREELQAAGLNIYAVGINRLDISTGEINDGELFVRFLDDNNCKRIPSEVEQKAIDEIIKVHDPRGLTQKEARREELVAVVREFTDGSEISMNVKDIRDTVRDLAELAGIEL